MHVNEAECEAAGLDLKKVESIARRLSKVAKEAKEMGIEVFVASCDDELTMPEFDVIGYVRIRCGPAKPLEPPKF